MKLDAAIFDMDGLLVDTEPLWHDAEVQVLKALGVPLTRADCLQPTGLRIDEVVAHWRARFPWSGPEDMSVANDIIDEVARLVALRGRLLPGAEAAIGRARTSDLRVALASSSPMRLITAILDHFHLTAHFEVIRSAETEAYGKPHPATFITTALALGVHPVACVALEDSFRGVLAAKAARMRCVVVPEPSARQDPRWVIADLALDSLEEIAMRGFSIVPSGCHDRPSSVTLLSKTQRGPTP